LISEYYFWFVILGHVIYKVDMPPLNKDNEQKSDNQRESYTVSQK